MSLELVQQFAVAHPVTAVGLGAIVGLSALVLLYVLIRAVSYGIFKSYFQAQQEAKKNGD